VAVGKSLSSEAADPFDLRRFVDARSVDQLFGWPDNLKVHSSMTLFARATDDNGEFRAVLDKFYDGEDDPATVERLSTAR
jgi:uncharacterized protein (DUF1810 family)